MSDPVTHTSESMNISGMPEGFQFPTGQQIYDMIMGQIEPELLTANLDTLDAPYAGESKDAHDARYERYSRAFAKYKVAYAQWVSELHQAIGSYKRAVRKAAEGANQEKEEQILKNLEDQFSLPA